MKASARLRPALRNPVVGASLLLVVALMSWISYVRMQSMDMGMQ